VAKNTAAIKAMDAAGGNVGSVLSGVAGPTEVSWAPTGASIAFRDLTTGGISRVDADGTNRMTVLVNTQCGDATGGGCTNPAWSPLGNEIAAIGTGGTSSPDRLMVVPAGGGTPEVLYVAPSEGDIIWDVAWSPDGTRLAVSQAHTGDNEVILVERVTGTATSVLTFGDLNTLDWGRGSSTVLALTVGFGQTAEIYLFDIAQPSQAPVFLVRGRHPSFAPDNLFVVFEELANNQLHCTKVDMNTGVTARLRREAKRPDWCRACPQ
jgi:Tol biopolymer transport system component